MKNNNQIRTKEVTFWIAKGTNDVTEFWPPVWLRQNSDKQTALRKSNVWLAGTSEAYFAIVSRNYGQMGSNFERKPYLCNVESSNLGLKQRFVKQNDYSINVMFSSQLLSFRYIKA